MDIHYLRQNKYFFLKMENYFTSSYEISSFVGALNLLLRGAHAVLQHPTLNNGINVKIPPTKMKKLTTTDTFYQNNSALISNEGFG
jgi:hypothetical protein